MPEARLALDGWIDVLAETSRVEARARLDTDLARASRLVLQRDVSLTGSATADVEVRGEIADPTVNVEVLGPMVRLGAAPSVNIAADATYASGRIDIDSLSVASDAGAINVNGTLAVTAAGAARESRLVGRIENLDVDRLLEASGVRGPVAVGTTAAGQIDVTLDAAVPLDADAWRHASVNGSVALTPTGSGLSIGGRLDPAMRGGRWALGHALRSQAGRTSIDGTLSGNVQQLDDPTTHSLSGSTRVRIEEVRTLIPVLQQAGVSVPSPLDQADGIVELRIDPRGTIAAPALNATISGRGIRVPGIDDAGELDSTVAIDRRALNVESLDARLGPLRVSASGEYTWRGQIEGQFDANADDLGTLASALDLADASVAGSAALKGSLHGTIQSPRGEGQLTARNLSAYGVAVGPVTARLRLDQGRAHVDADVPDLEARATGAVDTRDPFGFQAEIDLDRSPLSTLLSAPQTKHLQAGGTIAATLRARGAIARLADTAGDLELRALDATVAGVPIALDTRAVVSFEPNALSSTPLLVRVGRETEVRLQGALSANGAPTGIDVQVESAIADLLSLAAPALPELPIEAGTSRVKLDLHVGGTLAAPQPSGTLALEAASLRYADIPPFSDVILDARIEPARIALNAATARWQGASLSADGAIPLRMIVPPPRPGATGLASWGSNWLNSLPDEPRSATLSARVTGVTTEALASFVDPAQLERVALTADATLTADADRFALDALRASIVLDQASLSLAGVPFTQSTPTRVRLEGGRARLEELRWDAQGNELRASGSADLIGPAPALDLAVDGALDLRVLGAFASGIASGGIAHTAFKVTGPLASPQIVGSIDVSSGELRLETPSLSASDLTGSIAVDATRKATMYLNGDINGGPAYIEGSFALDEITSPRGRITLTAWNVMLEYPEGFQTESNANLSLTLGPGFDAVGPRRRRQRRLPRAARRLAEPAGRLRRLRRAIGRRRVVVPGEPEARCHDRHDERDPHRQQLRPPEPDREPAGDRIRRAPGSPWPDRCRTRWRGVSGRQHLPDPDADHRSHEPSCHLARGHLSRRDARGQHADRNLAAVRRFRPMRARGPIAGRRNHQRGGGGQALRHLDRSQRSRRSARAAAIGRAAGPGQRLSGPRHAAARSGRRHRSLRRPDARRGRRQSRLAADGRQTRRRPRRARLLAGSRRRTASS